jgi:hypothetical protein
MRRRTKTSQCLGLGHMQSQCTRAEIHLGLTLTVIGDPRDVPRHTGYPRRKGVESRTVTPPPYDSVPILAEHNAGAPNVRVVPQRFECSKRAMQRRSRSLKAACSQAKQQRGPSALHARRMCSDQMLGMTAHPASETPPHSGFPTTEPWRST